MLVIIYNNIGNGSLNDYLSQVRKFDLKTSRIIFNQLLNRLEPYHDFNI